MRRRGDEAELVVVNRGASRATATMELPDLGGLGLKVEPVVGSTEVLLDGRRGTVVPDGWGSGIWKVSPTP